MGRFFVSGEITGLGKRRDPAAADILGGSALSHGSHARLKDLGMPDAIRCARVRSSNSAVFGVKDSPGPDTTAGSHSVATGTTLARNHLVCARFDTQTQPVIGCTRADL
jgi:hypothetical protein